MNITRFISAGASIDEEPGPEIDSKLVEEVVSLKNRKIKELEQSETKKSKQQLALANRRSLNLKKIFET